MLLLLRIFITFRAILPSPHHTIVKPFPSSVHIRVTVMTGPASACVHNLVTWILFYNAASMTTTVTTCTRTRVANAVATTVPQGKERLSAVSATPIRKFAAPRKISLSVQTVCAVPGEGLMITDYGGSVISVLRNRYSIAANTIPNTTSHLPMSSWSAQVPFFAGVAPAVMCPPCVTRFVHVRRHSPRLVPNTHRTRE